jgi:hypothetical protein
MVKCKDGQCACQLTQNQLDEDPSLLQADTSDTRNICDTCDHKYGFHIRLTPATTSPGICNTIGWYYVMLFELIIFE